MRLVALTIVALAAACGGAASVAVDPTATPTSAAGTATPAATTGASWTVIDKSKATVRVHEQLVGVNLPSDAVLTATGAKGSFALNADGTFSSDSKVTFDLTTLSSDQQNRDNFVKQDTLNTRQFPTATFVPTKVTGLALPLAASGDFTFTLTGTLTIRGKSKQVTFDLKATRNGGDLIATATANPTLKFEDFGMSAPSVPLRVVSVTDEIRLVIDIVATGPAS
ncbi:MAG TPA: YceI family protein [Candidatus Limnocylindria bacterium]|nr:YceI family protein [Candidatus Limnocylindria bacterium]